MSEEGGVKGIVSMTAVQEQIIKEFETLCAVDVAALWGGAVTEHRLTDGVEAVDQQLPLCVAV
jgi:hypothetical protein